VVLDDPKAPQVALKYQPTRLGAKVVDAAGPRAIGRRFVQSVLPEEDAY